MGEESAPEAAEFTADSLLKTVREHLSSLAAAGVEWIPAGPLPREILVQPAASASVPTVAAPTPTAPVAATTPAVGDDTLGQARIELQQLAEYVSKCTRCSGLAATRTQTVFGVGKVGAELCLVGEAPGADEDRQGEPFVGAAGQLLNKILAACGFQREDVYICNVIKCRPPGNRTPEAGEIENCREYLERQLELLRPRYLCTLGASAAKGLLETTRSLTALRGKIHDFRGIPVVCTYHPAYLLPHRCPTEQELHARKKMVWDDMKFLMQQMGRPVQK